MLEKEGRKMRRSKVTGRDRTQAGRWAAQLWLGVPGLLSSLPAALDLEDLQSGAGLQAPCLEAFTANTRCSLGPVVSLAPTHRLVPPSHKCVGSTHSVPSSGGARLRV